MVVLFSILWILLCIVLQVLLFNQLHLFGGVVFIYLIALLKMPFQVNRSLQILIGFLTGLMIDIFTNTIGLHSIVCTTIMWLRMPILHMFVLAEDAKTGKVSISKFGVSTFARYISTMIALHSILFYTVQSFTLFNFFPLLLKIVLSFALTLVFMITLEIATDRPK